MKTKAIMRVKTNEYYRRLQTKEKTTYAGSR